MQTLTFFGEVIGDVAPTGTLVEQNNSRSGAKLRAIDRARTKLYLAICGLLAIAVSHYRDDPSAMCEYGNGVECERRACAYTVDGGNGYIVGCTVHAQELLIAAVEAGEIERPA